MSEKVRLSAKGVVVNGTGNLLGFMVTDGKATQAVPLDSLRRNGVILAGQIDFRGGKFRLMTGFSLKDLPMLRLGKDGTTQFVDNTMRVVARITENGELKGYRVSYLDVTLNLAMSDLRRLASWFRLDGYAVRKGDEGYHLVGLSGNSVLKLREIALNAKKEAQEKAPVKGSAVSIVDLLRKVNDFGGKVVLFNSDEKPTIGEIRETTASGFTSLKLGEVGSSSLQYSEHKLNASIMFREYGVVTVEVTDEGRVLQVPAYKLRSRVILKDGKINIPKFSVAFPKESGAKFAEYYNGALTLTPVKSTPMESALGSEFSYMYQIDTGELTLVTQEKIKREILSVSDVANMAKALICTKAAISYLNARVYEVAGEQEEGLYAPYRKYSEVERNYIGAAGVNLSTGAYTATEALKTTIPAKESISVEYSVAGFKSAPSASQIASGKAEKFVTADLREAIDEFERLKGSPSEALAYLKKKLSFFKTRKELYIKYLWGHNTAMFANGDYKLLRGDGFSGLKAVKTGETKAGKYTEYSDSETGLSVKVFNTVLG
jgi:hypothetical protein